MYLLLVATDGATRSWDLSGKNVVGTNVRVPCERRRSACVRAAGATPAGELSNLSMTWSLQPKGVRYVHNSRQTENTTQKKESVSA